MTKRMLMAMLALSMAAGSVACGDDDDDDSEDDGGDGDGGDGDGGDGDGGDGDGGDGDGGDGDDGDGGDGDGGDGDGATDNVAACENWKDSIDCGDPNSETLLNAINCDTFSASTYPCDISDYFNCLAENTTCDNDMLGTAGWQGCQDKATCN